MGPLMTSVVGLLLGFSSLTLLVGAEAAATTAQRNAFVGLYSPISSCASGCCCSTGPITVSPTVSSPLSLDLVGSVDGSAACFGMNVLTGTFIVQNQTTAIYTVAAISKTLILTLNGAGDEISLSAPPCTTVAQVTVGGTPTSGSTDGGSSSSGTRTTTTPTLNQGSLSFENQTNGELVPRFGGATYVTGVALSALNFSAPSYWGSLPKQSGNMASRAQMASLSAAFEKSPVDNVTFTLRLLSTADNTSTSYGFNSAYGFGGLSGFGYGNSAALQWVILRAVTPADSRLVAPLFPVTANEFEFQPLRLVPGEVMTFSLSYKYIFGSGGLQYESPVMRFQAPWVTSVVLTPNTTTSQIQSQLSDSIQPWLGTFAVVSNACVPSAECCCTTDSLFADPVLSTTQQFSTTQVHLRGSLDGGTACLGQTTFEATMGIVSQNSTRSLAQHTMSGITFQAALTQRGAPTHLQLSNSRYPTCPSFAVQTQQWQFNWTNFQGTSTGVIPAQTTLVSEQMAGFFAFDGRCVPSKTCCCGVDVMTVKSNSSLAAAGQVLVSSRFDGGLGCYGFSQISVLFSITDNGTAIYDAAGLRFTMRYQQNYTRVEVTDSFRTNCPSVGKKLALPSPQTSQASPRFTTRLEDGNAPFLGQERFSKEIFLSFLLLWFLVFF